MTTAISSAIQAAVISHASPMPVRTAHAARIVGTRMKTLNWSAVYRSSGNHHQCHAGQRLQTEHYRRDFRRLIMKSSTHHSNAPRNTSEAGSQ